MKLKKMGGEEETIQKNKVKARDKKHLTNKKPILDIMSQDRIPRSLDWNQESKDTRPLERTKLLVY